MSTKEARIDWDAPGNSDILWQLMGLRKRRRALKGPANAGKRFALLQEENALLKKAFDNCHPPLTYAQQVKRLGAL